MAAGTTASPTPSATPSTASTFDALTTAGVILDDSIVVDAHLTKRLADVTAGALITVAAITDDTHETGDPTHA